MGRWVGVARVTICKHCEAYLAARLRATTPNKVYNVTDDDALCQLCDGRGNGPWDPTSKKARPPSAAFENVLGLRDGADPWIDDPPTVAAVDGESVEE